MNRLSTKSSGLALFALGLSFDTKSSAICSPAKLGYCLREIRLSGAGVIRFCEDVAVLDLAEVFRQCFDRQLAIRLHQGNRLEVRFDVAADGLRIIPDKSASRRQSDMDERQAELCHVRQGIEAFALRRNILRRTKKRP